VVRIIVPYPAGGSIEFPARILALKFQEHTGLSAIVENKPGASGTIGTLDLVRSAPDGMTMAVLSNGNLAFNPFMQKAANYDPEIDLVPVSLAIVYRFVLAVNPGFPAKDVSDLVDYLKANPGKVNFGSAGVGTTQHLSGALFAQFTGTRITHVPYAGAPRVLPALMSGEIEMAFLPLPDATAQARAGKIRLLALTSTDRSPGFPQLKTIAEEGYPEFFVNSWAGFFLPKGTSPEIIRKYNALIRQVLGTTEVRAQFAQQNIELKLSSPEEFKELISRDVKRWPPMLKALGIKPE